MPKVNHGLGRAANIALGALPGFTLPGDISASDRYWRTDITAPFVFENGHIRVPTGPGLGVSPEPEALAAVTTSVREIPLAGLVTGGHPPINPHQFSGSK